MEYDFDAIVVGAGCAGAVAAYELASAGCAVLLVEKGENPGSKNMTGGRIYTHSLKKVFPDFESEAPLERRIVSERISLMAPTTNMTVEYRSEAMKVEGQESYSVLRGVFDQWLAEKAEEAGAELLYPVVVEKLLKDDAGAVCGISAAGDELTAKVVLLCDGVNSLLAEQAVGYKRPPASQMAVGIKQTIALPASVITDRVCAASDDEGMAWMIAGDATKGRFGGGFCYTNKDSISLGVVAGIESCAEGDVPVYRMMEELKAHPAVAPLIRGGEVVEHSGHMVPEGGINIMPRLYADGVILAGDSAMMCINYGYSVRGMDYAVAAGQAAGRAAAQAIEKGDTSAAGLKPYTAMLEGFVMPDFRNFQAAPAFMENATRMFNEYPVMVGNLMDQMFIVDGTPTKHVKQMAMPELKKVGMMNLMKDAMGGMKAL